MKIISRSILLFNFIAATALIISYLARYISPATLWQIAFAGLAYPILLTVNILFMLYWILRLKYYFFISLLSVLIGWNNIFGLVAFNSDNDDSEASEKGVKVLCYNVRLFDLYNWKDNKNLATRNKIFDFIRIENADVLCFQEFFNDDSGYFSTLDTLPKLQEAQNFHVEYTTTIRKTNHWGIATFSKYPIVGKGKIIFPGKSNNICIYTDLKIGDDTIRVYNMHLASIHFNYSDYKLLGEEEDDKIYAGDIKIQGKTDSLHVNSIVEGTKNILTLLKTAFINRAKQAEMISEHIGQSPYSVLVCGDFNDTPASYAYSTVSNGLTDAFRESGFGLGQTYIGKFPSFRIDFILHSKELKSSGFRKITSCKLSDHYPLSCYLSKETRE